MTGQQIALAIIVSLIVWNAYRIDQLKDRLDVIEQEQDESES